MERVILDIDEISKGLYDKVLGAFIEQFGEGYFDNWEISADKGE